MKKTIFFLVQFFTILHYSVFTQVSWELLNPKPSSDIGLDIHFISNNIGFIITFYEILETTNAGLDWTVKQNINGATDLDFHASTGFIVGKAGYALKSTDSGTNWSQVSTGVNVDFNAVTVISNDTIILSTSTELVKSYDAGNSWQKSIIPNVTVTKTAFTSGLVGHAVCEDGKILKTINGGVNWYLTLDGGTNDFFSLYFFNENMGFAGSDIDDLFKTIDGGETWVKLSNINDAIYGFHFIDENTGYISGRHGLIFKTTNGGASWDWASFQNGYKDATDVLGIYFTNDSTGYAVGHRGRIVKTTDGGNNWESHSPTYQNIKQIQFTSNEIGYALISPASSDLYKTTDAGNNWEYIGSANNNDHSSGFYFVNDSVGYSASGGLSNSGTVFKTIDGGLNWAQVSNPGLNEGINCVFFVNENLGFISGGYNSPKVMRTIDGGANWTLLGSYSFGEIQFLNDTLGYARNVGNLYNRIYKTVDGGANWTIKFEIDEDITSFHFLNENIGIFVGEDMLAQKTEDGGETWEMLNVLYKDYKLVKFHNANVAFIVDDEGAIYNTENGGQDWNLITSYLASNDLELTDTHIYLGGWYGKILRTEINGTITSIDPYNTNSEISIYPNPTSSYLNISTLNNKIASIEIFDLNGKLLINRSDFHNRGTVKISLDNLSRGNYFVKVNLKNNRFYTKKIILE